MKICGFNVTTIENFRQVIADNGSVMTLTDIYQKRDILVMPLLHILTVPMTEDSLVTDFPQYMAQLLVKIKKSSMDFDHLMSYFEQNQALLSSYLEKKLCLMWGDSNMNFKARHDSLDICLCFFICWMCREAGLCCDIQALDKILPLHATPINSRQIKECTDVPSRGFALLGDHVWYDGVMVRRCKTLAMGQKYAAYLGASGDISLIDLSSGEETWIPCATEGISVGDLCVDGGGGVVYLEKPYTQGTPNLWGISDELTYPEMACVDISVCDANQYALITQEGKAMSNIPMSQDIYAQCHGHALVFTSVSVSRNLMLAVTCDGQVFSSSQGLLPVDNAYKAVSFGRTVAILQRDGRVCLKHSPRVIAENVSDMADTSHGLLMLQGDAIVCLTLHNEIKTIVPYGVFEMAGAYDHVIYRQTNGQVVYMHLNEEGT